jgi:outer membrane protein TolC
VRFPRWSKAATAVLLLLAAPLCGCARPEQWGVFEKAAAETKTVPIREPSPWLTEPPAEPVSVPDGGPLELSVEKTVMLALANNRDLRVRNLDPLIAGAFERIERGRFDPELFAEFEYGEERSQETARSTGTEFSVEGSERFAVAGIRQELPTGTLFEASVTQERSISNRAPEQQSARLGLSVTQALLRGFGPAANLAEVRQAELDTAASRYELRGFTEALLADAEIAYWNYVLAREEIAIFERSLAVAEQQRDAIELRIEVGILAPIEAAAARAEVALRRQALIDARSQLEERRLRLLVLISPGSDDPLDRPVVAVSDPRVEAEPITDLPERLRLAEQLRPDLNEARLRLASNRLATVVTRNGLLPRLDLFIALGRSGFADTFGDSFRELEGNAYDVTGGIRLSHFLGNRGAEGRDLAARASRRQAAEAVGNLRQLVRLDVRLAANEVDRAGKQIAASRATRALQEETEQAEMERFDVGSSTALLVAQAQRDLLVSRIAEVGAIINYRIALVRLYLAEGSLLERRGIRFAESLF